VASAAWAIWRDAQFDWVELVSAHHDQQEDRREDLESVIFLEVIVRKTIDEALRIGRAHASEPQPSSEWSPNLQSWEGTSYQARIETNVRVGDQLGRPHQLDATEEELAGALSFLDIQLYDWLAAAQLRRDGSEAIG
jgi:hypothetical protein